MGSLRSAYIMLSVVTLFGCISPQARDPGSTSGPSYPGGKADDPNGPGDTTDGDPSSSGQNLGRADGGGCTTGCLAPIASDAGCGSVELCGESGAGNGLDDNCDGVVDEICVCRIGDVEPCFPGSPGKHHVGACTDGQQTCEGNGEFGSWGKCVGAIRPQSETCDSLDNDCNGCADDSLCCNSVLSCPGPSDARIAPRAPYTDIQLVGNSYFTGQVKSWSWSIEGGPCDQLFKTTTGNSPHQSFTLTGATSANAKAHFTLSGDYTVTLTVIDAEDQVQTCTWIQHISGPGLRFELCWDHTGDVDLDLHVHEPQSTRAWFQDPASSTSFAPWPSDCNYATCVAENYGAASATAPMAEWGFSKSPLSNCAGTQSGQVWASNLNGCANPRLDLDNVYSLGVPENINIDSPLEGQTFRVMVHDYSQKGLTGDQHPLVNVYCGGTIVTTYGQTPNQLTGFNDGGQWAGGSMWRVADVTAIVDASGTTTGCTVSPLHPSGQGSGYDVTVNDVDY